MEERSHGIVLRTRPLTDTSLIVQWLTPELGRFSTVAKGALRPKSALRGKVDLFFEADFSFVRSRRSDLHTLREVVLQETHPRLRQDIHAVAQGSYFSVLVERGTEAETPLEEIYQLYTEAIKTLEAVGPSVQFVLAFELRFLAVQGLNPSTEKLPLNLRFAAEALVNGAWEHLPQFSAPEGKALEHFSRIAIGTALGKILPQRNRALSAWH